MTAAAGPGPYLRVDYAHRSGLDHQMSNLQVRCHLARHLGATLVPSPVFLAQRGNSEEYSTHLDARHYRTRLDEFIDFSALVCRGEPLPVAMQPPGNISSRSLNLGPETPLEAIEDAVAEQSVQLVLNVEGRVPGGLLRNLPACREAVDRNRRRYPGPNAGTFVYSIAPEPKRVAGIVAERIGSPYTCVHVRRGDRLNNSGVRAYTRLDEIKKGLEFAGCPKVYIMSDEVPEYFAPLRDEGFRVFLHTDFPELRALNNPQVHGGHMLYPVERDLMRRADRRVVTRRALCFEYADSISPYALFDYALIPPHLPENPRPVGI